LHVDVIQLPHPAILETRTVHWPDEAACAAFAGRMARAIRERAELGNAIIELNGPLGAGKTSFVRHLLQALGVSGRIKSPTYAVVESYAQPGLEISHFDFYRFDDPREWEDAGFRDVYARPGLKLAEWPEKAASLLPPPDLRLGITPTGDDQREVTIEVASRTGLDLLR
jgi:tRNA threonylcarbamoyladenosine biosynthesis protein TsaE